MATKEDEVTFNCNPEDLKELKTPPSLFYGIENADGTISFKKGFLILDLKNDKDVELAKLFW